MLLGIDLSEDQGKVDHSLVAKAGISFAIIKATEGETYQDPYFRRNMIGAKAAGLVTGIYHYYHPEDNPVTQFQNLSSQLIDTDFPSILAVDCEGDKWAEVDPIKREEDLVGFLDLIEQKYGGLPMLYMSPSFQGEFLKTAPISRYKRWLAEYAPACKLPYDIWQYGQSNKIPGILTDVDMNRFEGDLTALNALVVPLKG